MRRCNTTGLVVKRTEKLFLVFWPENFLNRTLYDFFLVHKKQSFKCVILEEIINTSPSRSVALYACEWAQWRGTVKDSWEKMAWKISTSWSKIQQEESLNSGICFMLSCPSVLNHMLTWSELRCVNTCFFKIQRQAKNLETAHWRQMHSLPFASFANWWLFCKTAVTLTRIPNACLHWRDHINVDDVWYTDVSHTDISHTNRCIIHRCITHKDVSYTESADKETRKTLIENKKHKKSQKHQRKRLVSVHKESLNSMLRGAFMPGSSQHLSHCEKDLAAFQITCEHFRGSHKTNSQRIFLFK